MNIQNRVAEIQHLFPGVISCVTIAAAAQFLSNHYGAPQMLFALLLGLSFHFLTESEPSTPGIEFASSTLLRTGVALLGFRITFADVTSLGVINVGLVVSGVVATIFAGIVFSYLFGRRVRFGLLTGGSVAICGASAALAISTIFPKSAQRERDTIFTVIVVTTFSTIAMVVYPLITDWLALDDQSAGLFLGATIHDVAQVVGAGYSVSPDAGDTATLFKLIRVAMLVPVVLLLSFAFREKEAKVGWSIVPLFIVGFCVAVVINSTGLLPERLHEFLVDTSRWCLVAGIVAIGIKARLQNIFTIGYTATLLVLVETAFIALWILGGLKLL